MDWTAFKLSLQLAMFTCVILSPPALLLARFLAWRSVNGKSAIEAAVMLPLVLPPTVLGYYLLVALSPSSTFGALADWLFGAPLVFSFSGILLASLIINLPFAVQPMQRAFEGIPTNIREAAWVSGLSSWQTFWRIELPLAWPGIVSALALVFAHTLGEFGVILMIGGNIPAETRTLSIAIYDSVQAFRNGEAGTMAAVLMAFSFIAIAIVHLLARRRGSKR
ncbi:MAG: molybdate ABC transporter permease subunit [Alphaproteobacteria bacterium]|nr:molybdate ABC transporter permease subunit [Alphaproteobacteria bacterium]